MSQDHYDGLVTRLEYCDQVKITTRTARRWHQDGYGPQPRRIGGRVYYVQAEINEFMKTVKATPVVA